MASSTKPESRQFGSFSSSLKDAIASTRHYFFENEDEDDEQENSIGTT